jgi:hypothetical protein
MGPFMSAFYPPINKSSWKNLWIVKKISTLSHLDSSLKHNIMVSHFSPIYVKIHKVVITSAPIFNYDKNMKPKRKRLLLVLCQNWFKFYKSYKIIFKHRWIYFFKPSLRRCLYVKLKTNFLNFVNRACQKKISLSNPRLDWRLLFLSCRVKKINCNGQKLKKYVWRVEKLQENGKMTSYFLFSNTNVSM